MVMNQQGFERRMGYERMVRMVSAKDFGGLGIIQRSWRSRGPNHERRGPCANEDVDVADLAVISAMLK